MQNYEKVDLNIQGESKSKNLTPCRPHTLHLGAKIFDLQLPRSDNMQIEISNVQTLSLDVITFIL